MSGAGIADKADEALNGAYDEGSQPSGWDCHEGRITTFCVLEGGEAVA